jgi:hypothetical protein
VSRSGGSRCVGRSQLHESILDHERRVEMNEKFSGEAERRCSELQTHDCRSSDAVNLWLQLTTKT